MGWRLPAAPLVFLTAMATLAAPAAPAPAAPAAGDYEVIWSTIDSGGGRAGSAVGLELTGTIGQPETGVAAGAGFEFKGGFWRGAQPSPCAADITADGTVDVSDLVEVIVQWGACVDPPTCCLGDIDCNGTVDTIDLVEVILNWGPCR